jgi:undecaprenyl-diphosphatase
VLASILDPLTALALGLIQGVTEFLPVSSDGHIAMGARIFGLKDAPLALAVALHAGTLLATLLAFRADLATLARETFRKQESFAAWRESDTGRLVLAVVVATIPTGIIGLSMKDHMDELSSDQHVVAVCLMGSAVMVALTRLGKGEAQLPTLPQAFLIGIFQGLAVLPGLSRSGSTIAVAMLLGMAGTAAFRFSFLLSLPAVAGAVLLELGHPEELIALGWPALFGAFVAFVSGYAALHLLRGLVHRGNLFWFAFYLVPVSILLFFW